MPSTEDLCGTCAFYVGKLRNAVYSMEHKNDVTGFRKWEFYLGKMLQEPVDEKEAAAIESRLCNNCQTLSLYARDYLRYLKGKMDEFDEKAMNMGDEQKSMAVNKACAPVLRMISDGHRLNLRLRLFGQEEKEISSEPHY